MSARSGLLIIVAITLWRVVLLKFDTTDLFVDEAQYWLWSQHLDLGYYSKPPMIAWVIRAVTALAGSDDIFWIRIAGPLFHAATALVLMATARRFVSPAIAGWTGVIFVTAPAVALSSVFFSTDDILLFFIAVALWAYFELTERRSIGQAILLGVAFGCAFLAKYAILFLVPGGIIAFILIKDARIGWRDLIIAVIVSAIVAAPNLWWNLSHNNTTVRHTQDIAHWDDLGLNIGGGVGFFLTQFGVVGPIVFFAMLSAFWRMIRRKNEPRENILVWLSIPVVLLITLQALIAKAYGNWAATAYVAGTILGVWLLYRKWPRGLPISLAIGGIISVLLPIAAIFAQDLPLLADSEGVRRYFGRSDVSRKAGDLAKQAGLDTIVTDNRDIAADIFYTLRDQPVRLYAKPPKGFPNNYYEQELALPPGSAGDVLLVTPKLATCDGLQPKELVSWIPNNGNYKGKTLYIYQIAAKCLAP